MDAQMLWQLLLQGAWVLVPIALLAVAAVAITIARGVALGRAADFDDSMLGRLRDYVHEGELESAERLCRNSLSPCGRVLQRGVARIGRPVGEAHAAMALAHACEESALGAGLPWLAAVAGVCPMLGVIGAALCWASAAASAFSVGGVEISISGVESAACIDAAAACLVGGMAAGILALACLLWLRSRISRLSAQMRAKALAFLDILNEPIG